MAKKKKKKHIELQDIAKESSQNNEQIRWRARWEEEIGMGNTCISKADSCQCMIKTTTIL